MSVLQRIVSGSIASWAMILVSIITQLSLVPVYLMYWNASQYGLWLAITSLVAALQIFDSGHQQFIGYEFLKIGPDRSKELLTVLSAAIPIGFLIGAVQILMAWAFLNFEVVSGVFDSEEALSSEMLSDVATIVLLSVAVFGVFGSVGGILIRLMYAIGYYPRMAWWGVVYAIVVAIVPALVAMSGGQIFQAGFAWVLAVAVYDIALLVDIYLIMRRNGFRIQRPNLVIGARNLLSSQLLVLTKILEMVRTTGARLVLAPLAGTTNLAAFATMRTGANIAHQCLGTLTGPLMPELMRVLRERDQMRTEASFAMVWLVLVALMAPALVILQVIIEPLFVIWTRSQIEFEPMLFGVLSLGVLVFALAQPAMSVVTGNNLLRPQLLIAAISACIVVMGMMWLVPTIGILGAGIALLIAELFAAIQYGIVCRRWMEEQGMVWPKRSSAIATMTICIAVCGMVGQILIPQYKWPITVMALTLFAANFGIFWRSLPVYARDRVRVIFSMILPKVRII